MNYIKYFTKHCGGELHAVTLTSIKNWTNKLTAYRRQVNYLPLTKSNINVLNKFISYMQSLNCFVDLSERKTTNLVYSGTKIKRYIMGCWINHTPNNSVCDTIILFECKLFVIRLGSKPSAEILRGKTCFQKWQKLDKNKVLDKLKPSPKISQQYADKCRGLTKVESIVDSYHNGGYWLMSCKIRGAFHIDGNSMWPAGVCERYPEMRPIIEAINAKYDHKQAKMINNLALGFAMSDYNPYGPKAHANLAFAGRAYCTKKLIELANKLKKLGYRILGYNTDGIWAVGTEGSNSDSKPLQGLESFLNIGNEMGQFKIDYYGGDLYLVPQGWMYKGGYHKDEPNVFDKGLRGNYLYAKRKPYDSWTWEDCLQALSTASSYSIRLDENCHWQFWVTKLPKNFYSFKDKTDIKDLTL